MQKEIRSKQPRNFWTKVRFGFNLPPYTIQSHLNFVFFPGKKLPNSNPRKMNFIKKFKKKKKKSSKALFFLFFYELNLLVGEKKEAREEKASDMTMMNWGRSHLWQPNLLPSFLFLAFFINQHICFI